MIAGGTGITPMLQIISAVIREGGRLEMSLIFANKSEDDILLRNMIESLVRHEMTSYVDGIMEKEGDKKCGVGEVFTPKRVSRHFLERGKAKERFAKRERTLYWRYKWLRGICRLDVSTQYVACRLILLDESIVR